MGKSAPARQKLCDKRRSTSSNAITAIHPILPNCSPKGSLWPEIPGALLNEGCHAIAA
jgi:hypothetical protein